MNLLIDLCERRSFVVEALAEKWKANHDEAMLAWDIEQLCHEGADLCKLCRSMCDSTRQRLLEGKITDINGIGKVLLNVMDCVLRTCAIFCADVAILSNRGFEIKSARELELNMAHLSTMKMNFSKQWPFIDPKDVERSREEYKRGDYLDSGELLNAQTSQSA